MGQGRLIIQFFLLNTKVIPLLHVYSVLCTRTGLTEVSLLKAKSQFFQMLILPQTGTLGSESQEIHSGGRWAGGKWGGSPSTLLLFLNRKLYL